MTREEAIKNIKEHCYFANLIPQAKEALDLAIKALEYEPCEDVINRQAVLDLDFKRIILTTAKPAEMIKQKVKTLPPVNLQESNIGHWIEDNVDDFSASFGYRQFHCDNCGKVIKGTGVKPTNFCSNCGAKMEGDIEV